jgi:hypothetical protein
LSGAFGLAYNSDKIQRGITVKKMEGDSIDRLVWRALRGREGIVASLATIQQAKDKGTPVVEAPRLSIQDAINKLFDERRQHALSIASHLPPCPIADTPVLYLYDQIRLCMLFNLNGAAITFCGVLVEYMLKYATYIRENPGATFDTSAWEEFESFALGGAIDRAKKAGLLDAPFEKALRSFKDDLRNKYSHFNIQKITKDVAFGRTREINVATGEEKLVELSANTPTLQIIAKDRLDEDRVLQVFKCADQIVIRLYQSILGQTS